MLPELHVDLWPIWQPVAANVVIALVLAVTAVCVVAAARMWSLGSPSSLAASDDGLIAQPVRNSASTAAVPASARRNNARVRAAHISVTVVAPTQGDAEPLVGLRSRVIDFCNLRIRSFATAPERYNAVVAGIHSLCTDIEALLAAGVAAETIRQVVAPARDLQATAPFIERLQSWPRGYPGDYETIEYILKGENRACADSIAFAFEQYVLNSPPAYQHRNKIALQAHRVEQLCDSSNRPRILALAAGSGADLHRALPALRRAHAQLVLNDLDADALTLCAGRLASVDSPITYVSGNVLSKAKRLAALGPYDLIIAGGLFDYLSARHISLLLRVLSPSLRRGGMLFFSNIATENPYRTWMEFFGNWHLIERTEADVALLCQSLIGEVRTSVTREVSGLSLIVECVRLS